MATIKSYTDISQSKKLTEILPLESADMWYVNSEGKPLSGHWNENSHDYDDIPCWSLATLFSVLPEGYSNILAKSFDGKNYFCIIDGLPIETISDNAVDACYSLILELHELKML